MSTPGTAEQSRSSAHLIGLPSHTTSAAGGRRVRPVPSPLQESTVARSTSELSGSQLSPVKPSSNSRAAYSQDHLPTATALRTPNPAKKAPTSPAIEEFRSAVTRDALREEAKRAAQSRIVSAPVLAAAPQSSTSTSPTMAAHRVHRFDRLVPLHRNDSLAEAEREHGVPGTPGERWAGRCRCVDSGCGLGGGSGAEAVEREESGCVA